METRMTVLAHAWSTICHSCVSTRVTSICHSCERPGLGFDINRPLRSNQHASSPPSSQLNHFTNRPARDKSYRPHPTLGSQNTTTHPPLARRRHKISPHGAARTDIFFSASDSLGYKVILDENSRAGGTFGFSYCCYYLVSIQFFTK
jgi:hypothetical protein